MSQTGTSVINFSIQDLDVTLLEDVITAVVETTGGGVEVLDLSLERVAAAGWLKPGQEECIGNLGRRFGQTDSSEFWSGMPERAIQETQLISQLSPEGVFLFTAPVLLDRVVVGVVRCIHNTSIREQVSDDSKELPIEKAAFFEYTLISALCRIFMDNDSDMAKAAEPIALANIRRVFEEVLGNQVPREMYRNIPQLRELVPFEIMRNIIESSSIALNIPITIFDLSLETLVPTRTDYPAYPACNDGIRTSDEGLRRCNECNLIRAWQVILSRKAISYFCYAGFCEFAAPVFVEDNIVGTIIGGQGVPAEGKADVANRIQQYMVDLGIEKCEAEDMLSKHPCLSNKQINAAKALMEALGEDIIGKLAFENWRNKNLLEQRSAIDEFVNLVSSKGSLDEVFSTVLDAAEKGTNCDTCILWLTDESEDVLKPAVWRGVSNELANSARLKVSLITEAGGLTKPKVWRGTRDQLANSSGSKISEELVGWEALDRESIVVDSDSLVEMGSSFAVPILYDKRCVGVIGVTSRKERAFDKMQMDSLNTLAEHIGPMAAHKGLLNELTNIAGRDLDLGRLLDRMVAILPKLLGAKSCSMFLLDKSTGNYLLKASSGLPPEKINTAYYEPGEGLTGWVAKNGRIIRLKDVKNEAERHAIAPDLEWSAKHVEVEPPCDAIVAPLFGRDEKTVVGVIRVTKKLAGNGFTDADEKLLKFATYILGKTVESVWAFAESERRESEAALLRDATRILNSVPNASEVVNDVLKNAADKLNSECCMVFIRDSRTNKLVLRFGCGCCSEELIGIAQYELGEGFTGWIAENNEPIITGKDARKDARWRGKYVAQTDPLLASKGTKSFIGVPLRFGDEVVGVFKMINKIPTRQNPSLYFTEYDKRTLLTLGTLIAQALNREDTFLSIERNLTAITQIDNAFRQGKSRDEILRRILLEALKLTACKSGDISVLEERDEAGEREQFLRIVKAVGKYGKLIPNERITENNVLGDVVCSKQIAIVEDADEHPGFSILRRQYAGEIYSKVLEDIGSALVVPLFLGEDVYGVLCVCRRFRSAFDQAEITAVLTLAASAAMAIHSDRILQELRILNEISFSLTSFLETDELYRQICRKISQVIPVDALYIALYQKGTDKISIEYLIDEGKEYPKQERPIRGGRIGEAIRNRKPLLINRDPNSLEEQSERRWRLGNVDRPTASLMYVPLIIGERAIGILSVQTYTPYAYTYNHLSLLSNIGRNMAIAIENARLYRRRSEVLDALKKIGGEFSAGHLDIRSVLDTIHGSALELINCPAGLVRLVDTERDELVSVSSHGYSFANVPPVRIGEGFDGDAVKLGTVVCIQDVDKDDEFVARRERFAAQTHSIEGGGIDRDA